MSKDGCHEHNFTVQSVITDAKRKRKRCAIAWLDLRNAFGSVPHDPSSTRCAGQDYARTPSGESRPSTPGAQLE